MNQFYGMYFRFIRGLIRLFYPKYTVQIPDTLMVPSFIFRTIRIYLVLLLQCYGCGDVYVHGFP